MKHSLSNNNIAKLNPNLFKDLLVKYSKELDIEKWDIGATSSRDISVQVQQGNAKQLKGSQRNSMTLRVWNKKKVGITSTSDLTNQGIKKAMRVAIEASYFGNEKESPDFSTLAQSPINELNSISVKDHGIDELLVILKKAEKQLINSHISIDSVPYNGLSQSYMEKHNKKIKSQEVREPLE